MSELQHYGVKGMKWGVRRDAAKEISKASAVSVASLGASQAGRMIGGAIGSVIAPGTGTVLGATAGSAIGGLAVSKVYGAQIAKKKDSDKANLGTRLTNRNSNYTDKMAKEDVDRWGIDSAKRINQAMNSGASRQKALSAESSYQSKVRIASLGAGAASAMVAGRVGSTSVRVLGAPVGMRAANNRQNFSTQRKASNLRGLPAPLKATKPRRGVYNITSA